MVELNYIDSGSKQKFKCDACPEGAKCAGTGDCMFNIRVAMDNKDCKTPLVGIWAPPYEKSVAATNGQPGQIRELVSCPWGYKRVRNKAGSAYYLIDAVVDSFYPKDQEIPKRLIAYGNSSDFRPENQKCVPCAEAQYIVNETEQCQTCPNGATCKYGNLTGNDGSYWRVEGDMQRVYKCDPGYVMVRNDNLPFMDQCIPCLGYIQ